MKLYDIFQYNNYKDYLLKKEIAYKQVQEDFTYIGFPRDLPDLYGNSRYKSYKDLHALLQRFDKKIGVENDKRFCGGLFENFQATKLGGQKISDDYFGDYCIREFHHESKAFTITRCARACGFIFSGIREDDLNDGTDLILYDFVNYKNLFVAQIEKKDMNKIKNQSKISITRNGYGCYIRDMIESNYSQKLVDLYQSNSKSLNLF